MSAETIYAALIKAGLTPASACGLMGNMYAESGLKANIAQRGMTSLSDEQYTAAADAGTIDFIHDSCGYGICQWTYFTRKQSLLNYARTVGKSVGDEDMQVAFCVQELKTDYPTLWSWLCTNNGIFAAAKAVCEQYEKPAVNNIEYRATAAQNYYNQLKNVDVDTVREATSEAAETASETFWPPRMLDYQSDRENLTGADVLVLQAVLQARGYNITPDGDFGSKTKIAVMAFQAESGLTADGVCGNKTWSAVLKI